MKPFEDLTKEETINAFLEVIKKSELNNEAWPIGVIQLESYFDADLALKIYEIIKKISSKGTKKEEIGRLFEKPIILRYFLADIAIVGLKIVNKIGLNKITKEEKVDYFLKLSNIISTMVISDPFCRDGKNLTHSDKELTYLIENGDFIENSEITNRLALNLNIDLLLCNYN